MALNDGSDSTLGLVLQGGGARGAYQVGAIRAMAEISRRRRIPFPVISGASVGAINAAPLAAMAGDYQRAARQLERLWRGLSCDKVYNTHPAAIAASSARWLWTIAFGGLGIGDPVALLDNAPLGNLLEKSFNTKGVARNLRSGALQALAISASSYGEGSSVTFFQADERAVGWKRSRRFGVGDTITHHHLLASSSLPFVFPAIAVDGNYYGDGALRLSAPLSPAIRLGAERLLVVGVRDNVVEPPNHRGEDYPTIGVMTGHALDIIFNDDLDADIERLERINRTVGVLDDGQRETLGLKTIDIKILQPTADLRAIAQRHAHEMPRSIRLLFKSIGAWGSDGRLVSYLLFEPGYIGDLIDLAYSDTMARKDELEPWLAEQGALPSMAMRAL